MDANFKLKQKERGFSDPPLSNGLAYMVSNERLQDHLNHCTNKGLTMEVSDLELMGSDTHINFLSIRSTLVAPLSTQSARPI